MKIVFDALKTRDGIVSVSYDGGTTYQDYNVSQVKDTGIDLDDNQDLSLIKIKSTTKVIDTFDVIKNIVVKEEPMFIMDDTNSWPYCVRGINFPKTLRYIDTSYLDVLNAYGEVNGDGYVGLDYFSNLETIKVSKGTIISPEVFTGLVSGYSGFAQQVFYESLTGGYYLYTAPEDGYYHVNFSDYTPGWTENGYLSLRVYVNGVFNVEISYESYCKQLFELNQGDVLAFKYSLSEEIDEANYNPNGNEEFGQYPSIWATIHKLNCTFY